MAQGPSTVDRLSGVNEGIAVKAPCRCATTGPITLSGLQTLDGVLTVAGDRVLVKNQLDPKTNGIRNASTGIWTRALDFDGNRDLVKGSRVRVNEGTVQIGTAWAVDSSDPITIDTDNITFIQDIGGQAAVSIGLAMPVEFAVAGSPAGPFDTFTVSKATQAKNLVWAGPATGADAQPSFRHLVTADLNTGAPDIPLAGIDFIIDGQGLAITTGIKGDLVIPFACTITSATPVADRSGSIVVNIWKCTYAQFDNAAHPVAGDKITASAPPTITTAHKAQDTTLTGWTTAIAAGDVLRFNVDSCTTIQRATLSLKAVKA